MSNDIKYLSHWESPFSHKKTAQTEPPDVQAAKAIDENASMLAKEQANLDIKQEYGDNTVNDTIDSANVVQDAFTSIPAVGTDRRKAYYDAKNWAYDDTIKQSDSLVDELKGSERIMQESVDPLGSLSPWERQTARHEGFKDYIYTDTAGNPTTGYGHKLSPEELKGMGLESSFEANQHFRDLSLNRNYEELFKEDYNEQKFYTQHAFDDFTKDKGAFSRLDPDAQGILTDLGFNMGADKLKSKFPKFLKAMQAGEYEEAANQLRYVSGQPGTRQSSFFTAGGLHEDGTERSKALYDKLMELNVTQAAGR